MKQYFSLVIFLLSGCFPCSGVSPAICDEDFMRFWNNGGSFFSITPNSPSPVSNDGQYKSSWADVEYYDSLTEEQRQRYIIFRKNKNKCNKFNDRDKYNYITRMEKVVNCFYQLGYEAEIAYRDAYETENTFLLIDGKRIREFGVFCPKEDSQNCVRSHYGYSVRF